MKARVVASCDTKVQHLASLVSLDHFKKRVRFRTFRNRLPNFEQTYLSNRWELSDLFDGSDRKRQTRNFKREYASDVQMFAFAFRAIASVNCIANLFLSKKEGSGHCSCRGSNPDQRIKSRLPYPLRQLVHGFGSQILRRIQRDSKFLKSLQTKKSSNAQQANTRSAKHQCETCVYC